MLGVELFHQTPNAIGGMGSTGFSSGTLFHQPSSEIGVTQSTGFNIGGINDFTNNYHLLFSFGRGLQHAKETNEFSWYIGFQVTGGE